MEDENFKKWEEIRAKGRILYMFHKGLVGWGGFMLLYAIFLLPIFKGVASFLLDNVNSFFIRFLIMSSLIVVFIYLAANCIFYFKKRKVFKAMAYTGIIFGLFTLVVFVTGVEIMLHFEILILPAIIMCSVLGLVKGYMDWDANEANYYDTLAERAKSSKSQ